MRRCTRCVLTENHANVWFNKEGVCNYCLEFKEATQHHRPVADREDEFVEMLEKHRGRGEYDCLVMLSGGKDSTYALYLLKERYKLNVLSFTYDNGFESETALENIRKAVDALEVDHLYLKPVHMKRLFRFLLQSGVNPSVLCPPCKSAMNTTAWEIAKKLGIGLIVSGNTKGQRNPRPMQPDNAILLRKVADLIEAEEEFRPRLSMYFNKDLCHSDKMEEKDGIRIVSPYYYTKWDGRKAMGVLGKTLGWKAPIVDYPRTATNCLMSLVVAYASRVGYGFSFHNTEMSVLIRHGEMTREEALQALEMEIDRDAVAAVLSRLGLSFSDVEFSP